jgi:hypothetical protein
VAVGDFANNDAVAIGSDGKSYQFDPDPIDGCPNFDGTGSFNLTPGGPSTTGCVAFQLPTSVKVAKVDFTTGAFTSSMGEWLVP